MFSRLPSRESWAWLIRASFELPPLQHSLDLSAVMMRRAQVALVASLCLDTECHSFLNGYIGGLVVLDSDADQTSLPLIISAGITQRLTKRVKLLVEIDGGAVVGDYDAVGDGVLAWYGARFTGRNLAVNVGFAKPIIEDLDSDVLPLGFPWVSLTYRGLPGE